MRDGGRGLLAEPTLRYVYHSSDYLQDVNAIRQARLLSGAVSVARAMIALGLWDDGARRAFAFRLSERGESE